MSALLIGEAKFSKSLYLPCSDYFLVHSSGSRVQFGSGGACRTSTPVAHTMASVRTPARQNNFFMVISVVQWNHLVGMCYSHSKGHCPAWWPFPSKICRSSSATRAFSINISASMRGICFSAFSARSIHADSLTS